MQTIENDFDDTDVNHWLGDGLWLGRVHSLKASFGYLTVYDVERQQVLEYPDRKLVNDVWFLLENLSIEVDDLVIFKPENAPENERKKQGRSRYSIQAQKGTVRPVREISEFFDQIPRLGPDAEKILRKDLLHDLIVLGERIFIVQKYADELRRQIQADEEETNKPLRKRLEQRESQAKKAQSDAEAEWEKANASLIAAEGAKRDAEARLSEIDRLRCETEANREQVEQQLRRWGLVEVHEPEKKSDPLQPFVGSESQLIEAVQRYMASKSFSFNQSILANFYTCLHAVPFTILAGLSGTGKSSLPRLFAAAINAEYVPISVKGTWTDDSDLLGFYHPVEMFYFATTFTETFVQAAAAPDRIFIVCLDEMNLSRVEYYFAAMLNLLDLEEDRGLTLYSQSENLRRQAKLAEMRRKLEEKTCTQAEYDAWEANYRYFPPKLPVPPNVLLCGTVNIDETTHPFSDKVLDRIQILQFEDIAQTDVTDREGEVKPVHLTYDQFRQYQLAKGEVTPIGPNLFDFKRLNQILRPHGFHFGHRVHRQIEKYYAQAMKGGLFVAGDSEKQEQVATRILDLQLTQKVLPKIRGINRQELTQTLFPSMETFCNPKYPSSLRKVKQLAKMDPINYWLTFRHALPD